MITSVKKQGYDIIVVGGGIAGEDAEPMVKIN